MKRPQSIAYFLALWAAFPVIQIRPSSQTRNSLEIVFCEKVPKSWLNPPFRGGLNGIQHAIYHWKMELSYRTADAFCFRQICGKVEVLCLLWKEFLRNIHWTRPYARFGFGFWFVFIIWQFPLNFRKNIELLENRNYSTVNYKRSWSYFSYVYLCFSLFLIFYHGIKTFINPIVWATRDLCVRDKMRGVVYTKLAAQYRRKNPWFSYSSKSAEIQLLFSKSTH